MKRDLKPETLAIHEPTIRRNGAIAPPIHLTTTFEHGPANEAINDYIYVRHANPNVSDFEARIAALEGGIGAVAYASGMASAAAMLMTLPAGSRVVFHRDLYFDVKTLGREELPKRGVTAEFIDFCNKDEYEAALSTEATLVWLETPSNPKIDVIDIRAVSEAAKNAGAKVIVDNTFATPVLQNPFTLGADFIMHSATKYMGGHSDVQGGAIVVRDDKPLLTRLHEMRTVSGGVLAPFNAWLCARGLQSLYCRMEKHCASAEQVAAFLDQHDAVDKVHYPFLESNPRSGVARSQMKAGGGMAAMEVKGGRDAALKVASRMQLFVNATSLGGVESLIEHRASIEGPKTTTPDNLLRLSIGLEHVDDLIADLAQALEG